MYHSLLVTVLVWLLVLSPIAGAVGALPQAGPSGESSDDGTQNALAVAEGSSPVPAQASEPSANRTAGNDSIQFVEPDESEITEAERDPNYTVAFHAESVTPEPGLDPAVTETDRERTLVLVQFWASPFEATFDRLAEFNYGDVGRLTATSRYAEIPVADAQSIADLDAVRAVTAIDPAWKTRPSFEAQIEERDAEEPVQVTIQAFGNVSAATVDEDGLQAVDVSEDGVTTYYANLSAGQIEEYRQRPEVFWIEERMFPEPTVSEGRRLVGAEMANTPGPWTKQGYTGQGVSVGVLDTGIEFTHSHFDSVTVDHAKDWWESGRPGGTPGISDPPGRCDHGTHVSGTIAGTGTDPGRNVQIRGVAPDARLVVSNVFKPEDGDPSATDCKWIRKPVGPKKMFNKVDNQGGVDVISNSWGKDTDGNYNIVASWVDTWAKNNPDTLVVFSNGNAPGNSHTGSPGVAKNVLTVGALGDGSDNRFTNSDGNVKDRTVGLTNRDSYLNDLKGPRDALKGSGRKKPEVYAPGESITAPVLNDNYDEKNGTSMATPHVSGVAALLKEKYPNMDANAMRATLVGTAAAPRYAGYGVVNANDALFTNDYEGVNAVMSGSVKKHRGARLTKAAKQKAKRVQNDEKEFVVSSDAERVVVTLTWLDPGNLVASRSDRLSNDLSLHLDGPNTDRDVTTDSNVKQIVLDDPDAGRYTIRVHASEVTAGTSQDYDVAYRTITEEPTLDAQDNRTIEVQPWERRSQEFTYDVNGTGAPVTGIYLDAEPDGLLSNCNDWPDAAIAGILSEGHGYRERGCVDVPRPTSTTTYPVEFWVNTSNAAMIDGAPGQNARRLVNFTALPHSDRDRFDTGGSNDGVGSATNVTAQNGWDHAHMRCLAGGRFSGGKSVGQDCSGVLNGGDEVMAGEFWTTNLSQLSLHDLNDEDHYELHLPDTHTPTLSNPECGSENVTMGGETKTVKTDGELVIEVDPTSNSLGPAAVRSNDSSIPLHVYDGAGNRVSAGTTSHSEYGITRTVPCPQKKGLSELSFSVGEGALRNAGSYEIDVRYAIEISRSEEVKEIEREMAIEAAAAEELADKIAAYEMLPELFDPDERIDLDQFGRTGGKPLCHTHCGFPGGPPMMVNQDLLVTVKNPRGAVGAQYMLTMQDGGVSGIEPVTGEQALDYDYQVETSVLTFRQIAASSNQQQAVRSAFRHGELRTTGPGMLEGMHLDATTILLGTDGDAQVTTTLEYDLTDDQQREAFEQLQADSEATDQLREEFLTRLQTVATARAATTDREMTVEAPDVGFETRADGTVGVMQLSAEWARFATASDDRLHVSAPFGSEFVADGPFVVRGPEGYALQQTSLAPVELTDRGANWGAGARSETFEATFVPAEATAESELTTRTTTTTPESVPDTTTATNATTTQAVTDSSPTTTAENGAGFGAVATLLALVVGGLFARRRR